ncbi:MAG: hypothetical protein ACOYEG_04945 [Petrimonas sp.]|jgi:hypothetical protein
MLLLDILFSLLSIFAAFSIKYFYNFNRNEKKLVNIIFVFHTIVCIAATPILFEGGDAYGYWMIPKIMNWQEILYLVQSNLNPTVIINLINYFPSNALGLSFPTGMFMYSFFGLWGFVFILLTVKHLVGDLTVFKKSKVFGVNVYPLIFLLPNMHFWSVGIGKDTLLFFAVSLFIYSVLNIKKRFLGLIVASTIAFFIRPHMLLFLVASFALAYLLSSKTPLYQKIILTGVSLALFIPLLNVVLEFAKIEELSLENFMEFSARRATSLSVAGSGIDLSGLPYPLKVLTFLFRPLFFDAHNFFAYLVSFENLIQIFLLVFFLKNRFLTLLKFSPVIIRACFLFYIIGALAFAPIMSNLGIIIREKNMIMPAFLIFILISVYYKHLRKLNDLKIRENIVDFHHPDP